MQIFILEAYTTDDIEREHPSYIASPRTRAELERLTEELIGNRPRGACEGELRRARGHYRLVRFAPAC